MTRIPLVSVQCGGGRDVRVPHEERNVCMTCRCGAIGSARSDAGGDIAARCPYPAAGRVAHETMGCPHCVHDHRKTDSVLQRFVGKRLFPCWHSRCLGHSGNSCPCAFAAGQSGEQIR